MISKKDQQILLFAAIPIIAAGALGDAMLIKAHSFLTYLIICAWEYIIFIIGVVFGTKLKC